MVYKKVRCMVCLSPGYDYHLTDRALARQVNCEEMENRMSESVQKYEFQTETRQLLDLMIHSVYSHKEIFLRELISNASDALDKLRFEAVKNTDLAQYTSDPHIRLEADSAQHTLTVSDNGIGMNRDEVIRFIGTIAKSGTTEYMRLIKEAKESQLTPELIGQFGVGFYSSFMVAEKVTLVTRRAGDDKAVKWVSEGDGTYTLEDAERAEPGTTVTLKLKPTDKDESAEDYSTEWTLRQIVKKYSDFVAYPIRMQVERTESERNEDGTPKEGGQEQKVVRDEVLNSMKAIWTRPEKEVTDEEYNEFYKHVSHDWSEPLKRILYKAEGTNEFRALLYIPAKAPFDLFYRDGERSGIHLYIKRVFIMNDCKELIPEYLRFVRGVVDSEDLSLNISREILQKNRQIEIIRKSLVRKVLDVLKTMRNDQKEAYATFWGEFGRVLKEGLFQDSTNRESLFELCLFQSTASEGQTTMDEYVARMKEGQDVIYYMTGPSRKAIENSPHLEAFREKGYEVLLFTDPVDEMWVQSVFDHKGKRLQSVGKGAAELGSDEERKKAEEERKEKAKEYQSLLDAIRDALSDHVKEVRLSGRLTSSPACLVGNAYDMTPMMEQIMRATGRDVGTVKRILELNPDHAILQKLHDVFAKDSADARIREYAELLYGQALLAEGSPLPDPGGFSRRLADLMSQSL